MVFGWTQIIMDVQPLLVMLTGEGHLHGFSHTYIGAVLLGAFAALSSKHLSALGLVVLRINSNIQPIAWWVVILSAYIGAFSHVAIDSVMHSDLEPFSPFNTEKPLLGIVSIDSLHKLCLYSGLAGAAVYYAVQWTLKRR